MSTTETASHFDNLEKMSVNELLTNINQEDKIVPLAVEKAIPQIEALVKVVVEKMRVGGRLFYICAGTSGRLGVIAAAAEFPVEIVTGPEFVTGSTRMKAGTAQKLALNMLTTATMIQLGHVKGNKMVDMQLSNHKLVNRAIRMVMDELKVDEAKATA